jgi:hypothetical protein
MFSIPFVLRLCGDFLAGITEQLRGLQYLDLEQCPDIETSYLQEIVSQKLTLEVKVIFRFLVGEGRRPLVGKGGKGLYMSR